METIGQRIRKLREMKNMTQTELSQSLGMKTYTTVSKWESDDNFPKGRDLKKLSELFEVSSDYLLGLSRNNHVSSIETVYNQLEEHRKSKVYRYAEKQLAKQNKIVQFPNQYDVDIYGNMTAGHGSMNFDKEHPIKTVKLDYVPSDYDIAFEVSGDSMHPTFQDGEIIFVKKTNSIHDGMLAAVEINDEAFIKKLYIEENRLRLVSLNCEKDIHGNRLYPDFYADEKDDIHLIGRVLS
ncbi:XRE family transcriptional regulator [Enterococcus casseliflavus]|uniref:XRE family transcriptional regulator n=1 Tax=Enterococcus casseliflavus TaxID=37734 RepID=UPI002DB9FA01|nr:XRE family transcriptional regulator [Enterococcus casseliflavus]MEB6088076.1 XRE family transcriptional regulator [Enterococcus casseliflavus]